MTDTAHNGHGGARANAGRRAKAEKFAAPIAAAEQRIADRLPQLIDNMFALADGVTVQTTDEETGATDVYTRPPDRAANIYLIDRILGKPTQRTEVTGEDGEPLFAGTTLTDDERLTRIAELIDSARARGTGLAPDRQPDAIS